MKISTDKLLPNPFRDLHRLPVRPEKVTTLKQSIKDTDFWDNIVARKGANGNFEIAYGHNRLEALKQLNWKEVDIPIRDLPDTIMLKMMANENMEEWGATADVEQETVRAVVIAFAAGKIKLPPLQHSSKCGPEQGRIAPSFSPFIGDRSEEPDRSGSLLYSAKTIGKFLSWPEWRVESALSALSIVEQKLLTDKDFIGLSPTQASAVARETRRVAKETDNVKLAIEIGETLADGLRESTGRKGSGHRKRNQPFKDVTVKTAKHKANQMMREAKVKRQVAAEKKKKAAFDLQKENRQVATFHEACKAFEAALGAAAKAVSKFSPEGKIFTIRRLDKISLSIDKLAEVLK